MVKSANESLRAFSRKAIHDFIEAHFELEIVGKVKPGTGGRPKKTAEVAPPPAAVDAPAPDAVVPAAPAPDDAAAQAGSSTLYKCKTCGFQCRDASSSRPLEHTLLVKGAQVRLCTDPQVTQDELRALQAAKVEKARGFEERLAAHTQLGRIVSVQPPYLEGSGPAPAPALKASDIKTLQKEQVLAALARGHFSVNAELDEAYVQFLKHLNPTYEPPNKKEIEALRDDLHAERLQERKNIIRQMGPGGVVTDGCRGKAHESMVNFIYIEGISGAPLYWDTVDMGAATKDGETLAGAILEKVNEVNEAAGCAKVRCVTTDRARANKVAWRTLEDGGLQAGPGAVHVHNSMVGDVFKSIPALEAANKEAYHAVDCFRKRPKLLADFAAFLVEKGQRPLTLVKARQERLGSRFAMARRLLTLKKSLKEYVGKRRFKAVFQKTKKERDLRKAVAQTLRRTTFWKGQRALAQLLSPVMRNLRFCDTRVPGKAGMLWPSVLRLQKNVERRLKKVVKKNVGVSEAEAADTNGRLATRALELRNDRVMAACAVHPYNRYRVRFGDGADGDDVWQQADKASKPGFYTVARTHPSWSKVQNQVVDYLSQKGMWLDGAWLKKALVLSLEAFWDEVATALGNQDVKTFMVDLLSHVVDSGDSERSWCYFANIDPKGSSRSRLRFATKEKEVGIMANVNLKRYLAQTSKLVQPKKAPRTRILKKQPTEEAPALPQPYEALWDAPEPEIGAEAEDEPQPMLALMDADFEGSELSQEDHRPDEGGAEEPQGSDSASDAPLASSASE